MRVETAIEEASSLTAQGRYTEARQALEAYADHPKAQYWLQRIERSQHSPDRQPVARDRMFTFSWNTLIALGIIAFFALLIIIIGLSS